MANVLLSDTNYADGASLSGGNWLASLPAENSQRLPLSRVARSADLQISSTSLTLDLGTDEACDLVAAIATNADAQALGRVVASTASDFSSLEYDSGWVEIWPVLFSSLALEWEDRLFWTGKLAENDATAYQINWVLPLPQRVVARYWRLEFKNQTNNDGYFQIGRLFIGTGWWASTNPSYGASVGWDDPSQQAVTLSGTPIFQPRPRLRTWRMTFQNFEAPEAYGRAFEFLRRKGKTGEVLVVFDADDAENLFRLSFWAHPTAVNAVTIDSYDRFSIPFEFKEIPA